MKVRIKVWRDEQGKWQPSRFVQESTPVYTRVIGERSTARLISWSVVDVTSKGRDLLAAERGLL